ncbi:VacJ family lipoprotein [Comamonas sp. NoAH]|uniref:MlaA family lipoprotein n=1 Tax=Comamonas halotolerans TaxID=3041496 RepID=UPI0024E0BC14|nr:VacJ family lipoprotein [Comamonas sp. NoAH]
MDKKALALAIRMRQAGAASLIVAGVVLSGCASTQAANPQDPYEGYNRSMTRFNDAVDDAVFKPVATAYQTITPTPVRTAVTNFFGNLGDLWSLVNHALQGNGEQAYNHVVRFTTNTVLGFGGLLDIATEMQVDRNKQDFGLTLGSWGIKPGPYLVLPFLGPSTVRDTVALPVDWQGYVLADLRPVSHRNSLTGLNLINKRANLLNASDTLDAASLDRYALMRDFYLKQRDRSSSQDNDDNAGRVESYDD